MKAGIYKAKAVMVGLGMTGTGKEEIAILFEVVDGDDIGQRITWHGYFTEDTTQRTLESVRNCGWHGDDLSVFCVEHKPAAEALLPYDVEIDVAPEVYKGETKMRVKWVNRIGSGGIALKTKLDVAQSKAFAQRMKGACKVVPAVKAPVAAPKSNGAAARPQREPGDDGDDDVPNFL